jgi:hypothetical protein
MVHNLSVDYCREQRRLAAAKIRDVKCFQEASRHGKPDVAISGRAAHYQFQYVNLGFSVRSGSFKF